MSNFPENSGGVVSQSRSVLNDIVTIAVKEVQGVASIYSRGGGKKTNSGVKIEFMDNHSVIVDVSVNIFFGCGVPDAAFAIQENVKQSVETMTEFKVKAVNVSVLSVEFESEIN